MAPSYIPTRMMAGTRRVFKSIGGKFFNKTAAGGRTYRPKATHITKGGSKFVVKHTYRGIPYGMKPKARYAKSSRSILSSILARRY